MFELLFLRWLVLFCLLSALGSCTSPPLANDFLAGGFDLFKFSILLGEDSHFA